MNGLSLEAISAGTFAVLRTGDPLPPELDAHTKAQAGHPFFEGEAERRAAYIALLAHGQDWLLEHLHRNQPRVSAALKAATVDLVMTARWAEPFPDGSRSLYLDTFLGFDGQYLNVLPLQVGMGVEIEGEQAIEWSRYAALPRPIADAYYRRSEGFKVLVEPSASPWETPIWPAPIHNWGPIEEALAQAGVPAGKVRSLLKAMALRASGSQARLRVVLDTRAQYQVDDATWLVVDTSMAAGPIFHIKASEPSRLGVLTDPVATIDGYVAWVIEDGKGQFDFQPGSETIISS